MMKKWNHHTCKSIGLLVIRIGLGVVFVWHGWDKLTHLHASADFPGYITIFTSYFHLSAFWAYIVAGVEFLGGIAMILGIGTWIAGLTLAINMLFAIILVKAKMFAMQGFTVAEIDIMLFTASLGLALAGPGKYSLERYLCKCGKCAACTDATCDTCATCHSDKGMCSACGCGDNCKDKEACKSGTCATCPCNK